MTENTAIPINYSENNLHVLIEEYITRQETELTYKDVCLYFLYWAREEGKATKSSNGLYDGDKICQADNDRYSGALERIVWDGYIITLQKGDYYRSN